MLSNSDTTGKGLVAIDARCIDPPISGIGRYALNLLRGVRELGAPGRVRVLVRDAGSIPADLAGAGGFDWVEFPHLPASAATQWKLPGLLRRLGAGSLHCPDAFGPLRWSGRTVITIHDVIPLACRGQLHSTMKARYAWVWKRWLRLEAARADAVVTVSRYSADDLVGLLGLAAGKIRVIHNGVERWALPGADIAAAMRRRLGVTGKVVLYVGRRDPTKNLAGLVRAFAMVRTKVVEPVHLVIAGKADARYQDAERETARLDLGEWVRFPGYVEDADLPALYRAADVFVFPSLYEGFGLPPLEAMTMGVPVVASNRTSLPEVLGDGAVLVDVGSDDAMAAAIERVLTDGAYARELGRMGLEHSERFSLKAQAEATLELHRALCSNP